MKQLDLIAKEKRTAIFSPCRKYRYTLEIEWSIGWKIHFIGLNPSTADECKDDNTVRKCKQFSKNWGAGGMVMTNIFGFRATDPNVMKAFNQPIDHIDGRNDEILLSIADECPIRVAAWGNHGRYLDRGLAVTNLFQTHGFKLRCFRKTKLGMPEHPLYIKYGTELINL